MTTSPVIRVAILDMYEGTSNQGMRCILDILQRYPEPLRWRLFDVRSRAQLPDLNFDIYISTGGPGDPREGDGHWDPLYYAWLQSVWDWNLTHERKKYVFFICHSFQMAVHHFKLAEITRRKSMSFGTFPVFRTPQGRHESIFKPLPAPFWVADFRRFQVVQPHPERIAALGAKVLAMEKIRPHVPLERAIMAIRFSPEMFGTQFHPEADPAGMLEHFHSEKIKAEVIEEHGERKWNTMIHDLENRMRISLTHHRVIPGFLQQSIAAIREQQAAATSIFSPVS